VTCQGQFLRFRKILVTHDGGQVKNRTLSRQKGDD